MKNLNELQKKLNRAESLQQELLGEMNAIDRELAGLQPSDPRRPELKAKKADLLPRYRGAKQHAKDLRRHINSAPVPKPEPEPVLKPDEDDDFDNVHASLGETLAKVLDAYRNKRSIKLNEEDIGAIEAYLDWWEN